MEELPTPPIARRDPAIRQLHGETVRDEYAWMRDGDDPAFLAHLRAERAFYDAATRRLEPLIERLAAEAAGRVPEGDEYSVAWPRGAFSYRTVIPQGADYEVLLRRRATGGEDQVLLDESEIAVGTGYVEVGIREPSPDGNLLAWSADTSGDEVYELRIRDLRTGEDLPEVIPRSFPGVAWSRAGDHLFYLVANEMFRPHQIWRHRVGSSAEEDVLVVEEGDERFDVTLEGSRSGAFAVIRAVSRDTAEVRLIPLEQPLTEPVLVAQRRRGTQYEVDHARGGSLYVVTDLTEPEFTLMRTPLSATGREHWKPVGCAAVAPARADTRLLRCRVLAEHLVLTLRREAELLLAITDHDGGNIREITSTLPAGTIWIEHAEEYDGGSVIIAEESLVEPRAWYRLDLDSGERELLRRLEVPGYDAAGYRTERRTARAGDGTAIPVSLAYREDTPLDGSAPCLLYGYGAYESSLDPEFERTLPSLLDRGVVYAVAHIRGGGEGGRAWWQQGRLRAKPTTFTDYIAVADWLESEGLIDGRRLASRGISAGGLLQGAVYSMRPDRWRAVVAEVPFVDVVTTMLDPSIPLTTTEWDEWGDPRDPQDYAVMRSYSPYDNPPPGPRPMLLATGAVNDPRVGIHEPAKWVARLRATDTTGSRILFRAETGVGAHGGPSGRSARFRYEAEVQAFILDALGIDA